jgi:outer membrane protein assembly factor BamB
VANTANNGRVFVSHSHDDNERCAPLLTALDAWGVDYFFDTHGLAAGQQLNERIQRELGARDIMLRICTAATQRSFWMSLEGAAFRGLQANDQRQGHSARRVLINLILDGDYTREPFDAATLFVDAASRPRSVWLGDLARGLGVTGSHGGANVSRRALVGYAAAAVLAVGTSTGAGALYLDYHPQSALAVAAQKRPGRVAWKIVGASPKKDVPSVPAVVGNRLYTMSVAGLTAYDLAHISSAGPARLWRKPYVPQSAFTSAAVYSETLYVGIDSAVYALNATTGAKQWVASLPDSDNGSVNSTPVLGAGNIYALSETGSLYGFSAKDGSKRWNAKIEIAHTLDHLSGPAVDGSSVYIGSLDHQVYAFDAHDGSVQWKMSSRGKVTSTAAVVNGIVYIGSGDGYVYALNAHDGSVRWKYLTGGDVNSSPAVVDGVVYVASDDHYLYTLDAESGKPYWRAPMGDLDASTGLISNASPVTCQPAVTGNSVSVIDTLYFVIRSYNRADGDVRWTYTSKDNLQNADPIGANGLVYFGSGDDTLYAFGA